jgi:coenzyme F420-reducing hydrogenase delta subunit
LEQVGIEAERLGIFYMSGSQAHGFANAAEQMTERIRRLGPSPLRKDGKGMNQRAARKNSGALDT